MNMRRLQGMLIFVPSPQRCHVSLVLILNDGYRRAINLVRFLTAYNTMETTVQL